MPITARSKTQSLVHGKNNATRHLLPVPLIQSDLVVGQRVVVLTKRACAQSIARKHCDQEQAVDVPTTHAFTQGCRFSRDQFMPEHPAETGLNRKLINRINCCVDR